MVGSDHNRNPRFKNIQHAALIKHNTVQPQFSQTTIKNTSKQEIQNDLITNNKDIQEDLQLLPLFISSVYINDKELPVLNITNELFGEAVSLIDSGASRNYMSREFIIEHHLEHMINSAEYKEVVAANKGTLQVVGEISMEIQFRLEGVWRQEETTFIVLRNLNHSVILGVPFVKSFGNQIDWSNLEDPEEILNVPELIDDYYTRDENKDDESDTESIDTFTTADYEDQEIDVEV